MREGRVLLVALAGYFTLQVILRLISGSGLEYDEAEAFWFSQHLSIGYGTQPPLYFWLQHGLFLVLGAGLPALALLKAGLFAGALWMAGRIGQRLAPDLPLAATFSILILALVPEILWEMQRDRTHTTLVMLVALVTLKHMLAMRSSARRLDFALLGLLLGLGVLSKHNFLLLPVGLVLGALWDRARRGRPDPILSLQGWLICLAVALPLVAPWAVWFLTHPDQSSAGLQKLQLADGPGLAVAAKGLAAWAVAVLSALGLPGLVYGITALALHRGGRSLPALGDDARVLLRGAIIALTLALIGVLAADATAVASRWLVPLCLPILLVGGLQLWSALGWPARRGFAGGLAALWLILPLPLYIANLDAPRRTDFSALLAALPPGQPILSTDAFILGNLQRMGSAPPLFLAFAPNRPPQGTRVTLVSRGNDLGRLARALGDGTAADHRSKLALHQGAAKRSYEWTELTLP